MPKYNVQEKIDAFELAVEDNTAAELMNEWKQVMLQHFKFRKEHLEDWQELTPAELVKLKNRVETIADTGDPWTLTQVKDLGLVAILYYNEIVNGD